MRWQMPNPCMGSRLRTFRTSMSRVPWRRSIFCMDVLVISNVDRRIPLAPIDCQGERCSSARQSGKNFATLSGFAVGDFVLERVHVDPELAASVKGNAGVQALSVFRDLTKDAVFRPAAANTKS